MHRRWLLICATRPEWGPLRREIPFERVCGLRGFPCYRSILRGQGSAVDLTLCQTGIGYRRVASLAPQLLQSFDEPPQLVVHFGLAGALVQGLKTGDLVVVSQVKNSLGETLSLDPEICKRAAEVMGDLRLPFREGALLTSEVILKTKSEKEGAGREWDALAADMETFPVAHECRKNHLPFLSVRAIFDTIDEDLSCLRPELFLDERGNVDLLSTLHSFIKNPSLLFQLPSFQRKVSMANKRVAQFLMRAIRERNFIQ